MKIRTFGTLAGMMLTLGLATVGFSGAAAAQYAPAAQSVTVNRTDVPPGGVVEVSGNANPNSTVTFAIEARVLGTALTNNAGAFRAGVTIPCDIARGTRTLRTTGPGINASTTLNVSGTTAGCVRTAGAGTLPRTGSSSTTPLAAAGIGLVLIGAVTAVVSRRRRSAANSAGF